MKKLLAIFSILLFCTVFSLQAGFQFGGETSKFKIGNSGHIHLAKQLVIDKGILDYQTNGQVTTSLSFPIAVNDGAIITDSGKGSVAGTILLSDSFATQLNGNTLTVDPAFTIGSIVVVGSGNKLAGDLLFTANNPFLASDDALTLQDSSAILNVALTSGLSKNIVLNGGGVELERDLAFSGTAHFKGEGVVNLNKHNIAFGGQDIHMTNTIFWYDPAALVLNAKASLSGTWTFGGGSGRLIGNGNILDISHTGTLWVKAGKTLHLADIKLKGLGNGYGSIVFEDPASSLHLSNVEIELANNYSVTQGNIFVEGNTLIVTKNFKLIFDNKGSLTVDGVALEYDTLNFNNNDNIIPFVQSGNEANLALLHNAVIRNKENDFGLELVRQNSNAIISLEGELVDSIRANSNAIISLRDDLSTIDALTDHVDVDTDSFSLPFDLFIHEDNLLRFNVSSIVIGNGHAIRFARNKESIMHVAADSTVYLKDVVLQDFDDKAVQLESGAQLIFSEGTTIELADSLALSKNLTFSGKAKLQGFGNKVIMNDNVIEIKAGGRLTLQDIRFEQVRDHNIRCEREDCTIVLDNVELALSHEYSFTAGSLLFERDVKITGSQIFNYKTMESSTIASLSTLSFDVGATFNYEPIIRSESLNTLLNNLGIKLEQLGKPKIKLPLRDLLQMTDNTSRLFLNGCTIKSSHAGLRLTKGTLLVGHKNVFENYNGNQDSYQNQGISFGNGTAEDDLTIEIFPGGSIDIQSGELDVNNASD